MLLIDMLIAFLRFIIPHWETAEVALTIEGDEATVLCIIDDLLAEDDYDGIGTMNGIAWLWWGFFGRLTNVREN